MLIVWPTIICHACWLFQKLLGRPDLSALHCHAPDSMSLYQCVWDDMTHVFQLQWEKGRGQEVPRATTANTTGPGETVLSPSLRVTALHTCNATGSYQEIWSWRCFSRYKDYVIYYSMILELEQYLNQCDKGILENWLVIPLDLSIMISLFNF